ncbi:hypothetical protein CBM2599_B120018 [Cupriavidus taiwanensis]|nr:hypothetical protein CBM2599_B120018 [Cupriavidus taiwanensis]SOY98218.1 hypothetical protein CBM2600_B130019 [Cupriavidus taiwanensis]
MRRSVKRGADARGAYHSFYRTYQNIYFAPDSGNFIYEAGAPPGQASRPADRLYEALYCACCFVYSRRRR